MYVCMHACIHYACCMYVSDMGSITSRCNLLQLLLLLIFPITITIILPALSVVTYYNYYYRAIYSITCESFMFCKRIKCYYYFMSRICWLHLIHISFSKTISVKRHLSGRKIFPAMLKSRSTGPEDAGTDKQHSANLLITRGYSDYYFVLYYYYYYYYP